DLRLADEGAAAVPALQVSVSDEIVERRPERQARDAELAAQPPLRGDCLADLELVDQLEDALPGQDLFAHGAPYGSTAVRTWSRPLTRNQRRIHPPLTPRLVCANLSAVVGGLNQLWKPGWLPLLREAR